MRKRGVLRTVATMDDSPRRARRALAVAVSLTAAASLVLVVAATARANLGARPDGAAGEVAAGVDLVVPSMLPGRSATSCAVVQDVPATGTSLRFFANATGELAPHLDVSIARGVPGATCADPGGTVPIYHGPLAGLGEDGSGGSGGSGTVVALSQRVDRAPYVFVVSLPADTPNEAQGAHATVGLRWEVMPVGAGR